MSMRPEKKLALFAVFIAGLLLLAACGGGTPSIALDLTEFEFGDVNVGEIISRDVVLSNEGTGTLVIDSVSTSCGCTTAVLEQMSIPAGQSTLLHITFDAGAHGDVTGFYTRQVFIASNDPAQPEVSVQFSANVIRGTLP
ncbi:MAG: DUF1573 domain-containing protein [Anaerolineales bacterium]